jgi:acetyltransferase-like isoleucine patch superfamily enzyme
MRRLKYEIFEIFEIILSVCPGTPGKYLRRYFYKLFFKEVGSNFSAGLRVRIQVPGNITVGTNVGFNYGVWIAANKHKDGGIFFGNNVLVGPYTIIHSGNHRFKDASLPIFKQGFEYNIITIEDDVWIAAHCTILSGVKLGKGCVVAAGSVVTKDVPAYVVVAGVPAKIISHRE